MLAGAGTNTLYNNLNSTLKNSTSEIKDIFTKVSDKMASLNIDLTPTRLGEDNENATLIEYANPAII